MANSVAGCLGSGQKNANGICIHGRTATASIKGSSAERIFGSNAGIAGRVLAGSAESVLPTDCHTVKERLPVWILPEDNEEFGT